MTEKTVDITCLGEPMLEFVRQDGGLWKQGFGGDTANTAIMAARSGAKVAYLTALGADRFGDELVAVLGREGVETGWIRRSETAPTGIYFVEPHESQRFFTYYRDGSAASRITPGDLPEDLLDSTRILHVSAISEAISDTASYSVKAAMARVRAAGGMVSYDTNLRLKLWGGIETARAAVHGSMAECDIALPSEDDAEALTGLEDENAIIDFYLDLGARIVALKLGERGAIVATREERRPIAPKKSTPVDSTGAGDAFAGGFLASLLRQGDPFVAGEDAAALAARVVSALGAVPDF